MINTDAIAYNFTFLGVTVAFTSQGIISAIGMIIGVIGLIMGFQRNKVMRDSAKENKRANDLKERELNAKAKDSEKKPSEEKSDSETQAEE